MATRKLISPYRITLERLNTAIESRRCVVVEDSTLIVQVTGPFSAGKSRLLREILTGVVPPNLLPVSSLGAETWLPLAITFGEDVRLTVSKVTRPEEGQVLFEEVRELETFPERSQLQGRGWGPDTHRLQLTVPRPELIIQSSEDLFVERPSRLCIVDTLGWDADGEQGVNETYGMAGMSRVARVLVLPARDVYAQATLEETRNIVREIVNQADEIGIHATLVVYITHCQSEDRAAVREQLESEIRAAEQQIDGRLPDHYPLLRFIHAIDLDELDEHSRHVLQTEFWSEITAGLRHHATLQQSSSELIALLSHGARQGRCSYVSRGKGSAITAPGSLERLQRRCSLTELWAEHHNDIPFRASLSYILQWLDAEMKLIDVVSKIGDHLPKLMSINFKDLNEGERRERIANEWGFFEKKYSKQLIGLDNMQKIVPRLDMESPFAPWWNDLNDNLINGGNLLRDFLRRVPEVYLRHSQQPDPRGATLAELNQEAAMVLAVHTAWLRVRMLPLSLNANLPAGENVTDDEQLLATTLTLEGLGVFIEELQYELSRRR